MLYTLFIRILVLKHGRMKYDLTMILWVSIKNAEDKIKEYTRKDNQIFYGLYSGSIL